MKYQAIVFDVSDTLVEYSPNYAQIYGERLRYLGFEVSEEKAKEISKAVNRAIGEQNLRESHGEPHIQEEKLNELLDKAALACVIDDNTYSQQYILQLKGKRQIARLGDIHFLWHTLKNAKNY